MKIVMNFLVRTPGGTRPLGVSVVCVMNCFFLYFFIDIQHAPLQSNTTCFYVKFSQYSYVYLHLCTISSIFYSYGKFTVDFLI